jgi:hypothetical protein
MAYTAFKPRGLIYLQIDADGHWEEMLSRDKNLAAEARKQIGLATDKWGEVVASKAKDRMSAVLAKSHRFKVGASGAASENLTLNHEGAGSTQSTWIVTEAGKTKANYFIRKGFKGTRFGRMVPEQRLKEWVADKGITLSTRDQDTGEKFYTRYKRTQASKKRKSYLLPVLHSTGMAGGKSQAERALSRIQWWVSHYGSKQSHWNKLYPVGAPRFDYVAYTIRQDKMWGQAVRKTGEYTARAIIEWLAVGKTPSGTRIYNSA